MCNQRFLAYQGSRVGRCPGTQGMEGGTWRGEATRENSKVSSENRAQGRSTNLAVDTWWVQTSLQTSLQHHSKTTRRAVQQRWEHSRGKLEAYIPPSNNEDVYIGSVYGCVCCSVDMVGFDAGSAPAPASMPRCWPGPLLASDVSRIRLDAANGSNGPTGTEYSLGFQPIAWVPFLRVVSCVSPPPSPHPLFSFTPFPLATRHQSSESTLVLFQVGQTI